LYHIFWTEIFDKLAKKYKLPKSLTDLFVARNLPYSFLPAEIKRDYENWGAQSLELVKKHIKRMIKRSGARGKSLNDFLFRTVLTDSKFKEEVSAALRKSSGSGRLLKNRVRHYKWLLERMIPGWNKGKCFFCQKKVDPTQPQLITLHHINNKHNDNTPSNLALAHRACHDSFNSKTLKLWDYRKDVQVKRIRNELDSVFGKVYALIGKAKIADIRVFKPTKEGKKKIIVILKTKNPKEKKKFKPDGFTLTTKSATKKELLFFLKTSLDAASLKKLVKGALVISHLG
jgi:hypothetical protein